MTYHSLGRACLTLALTIVAIPGFADEVKSKGTVVRGKIAAVTPACVEFKPEYGDGSIKIKWENVEDLRSDGRFHVLYGDDLDAYGQIETMRDGKIVVAGGPEVDPKSLYAAFPIVDDQPAFRDRMRSMWRYWDGNFDLGFSTAQSTADSTGLAIAFGTTRSKGPTRMIFGSSYRYGTQKSNGETSTVQNEAKALLRGEYDLTTRLYAFGSADAEYDEIERLSLRSVPKTGLGVVLWQEPVDENKKNFLRTELGAAYLYQNFFGPEETKSFSVAFGALAQYHLPFGSRIDWRFDYLPAVTDWANDFLIRTQGDLFVPMFDPLSLKLSVADEFNNKPANDAKKNNLFITLGLSVSW